MYDSLEEEARKKSVSLNTLLNQVITTTSSSVMIEYWSFIDDSTATRT